MKFIRRIAGAAASCALVLLTACGGGGGGGGIGGTGATSGKMSVSVTDAPSCGYDAVFVTIDKVRVNQSADALDGTAGWVDIPLAQPQRVDLLTLTNGVLFPLGEASLPAGKYQQMRLVLAENTPARPMANSVVPTGGAATPLDTPSAQQSGLKLNMNVDVPAGQVADVVLDFDACKSVVKRGNSGRYNLKPVISVIPVINAGGQRLEGWVDLGLASGTTFVSLQLQGVPVKTSIPDSQGRFVLFPVPPGTYDLVVTSPGHVTAVLTGVPVTSTAITSIGSTNLRFTPPASIMRDVTGTVNPATATVRAVQALSAGPSIEVASPPVDSVTGAFSMSLPVAAPIRAPYAANATTYAFTADNAAAGRYTVFANSNGNTQSAAIDTTVPVVPPLVFNVP